MKAILILVVTVFGVPFFALSQEELPKGPAHFKLEFENESILVLRIRLDPHEKTPMHQVTPRMVVWLTDGFDSSTELAEVQHVGLSWPIARQGKVQISRRLAQPHLDPTILLATVLVIIGSDWQVLPISVYQRWGYASYLQLFGDGLRAVFRKCKIPTGIASVVGESKNQETPLLIGWVCQQFYEAV